ncbi:hypothetical protein DICPUDRAFT_75508 [Dictyostelium purpureum]|uniref:FNIP repeat-containing protein n=1 Tax=Dictyostelium purpureum TaxID=5786 RepID=F0ZAV2_DICPU|nr:uncharacterized protein DICPUDRAFT_75508 [Dictyostelium purpureum]EGC38953.1 hypothetical protein DICPUDRAFT_75508 [Dictyostelium purpureum]|eukprot:XP_003284518.1 hypothetical protein DICPUDRAFT_75508 [Dictyostelium purpureum]
MNILKNIDNNDIDISNNNKDNNINNININKEIDNSKIFFYIFKNKYLKNLIFYFLRLFNNFKYYSFSNIKELNQFKYKSYLFHISLKEINQDDTLQYLGDTSLSNIRIIHLITNNISIVREINQINSNIKIELIAKVSDEFEEFPSNVSSLSRKVLANFKRQGDNSLIQDSFKLNKIYPEFLKCLEIPFFNGDALPKYLKSLKIGILNNFNILPKETLEYLEIDNIKMSITQDNGLKQFKALKQLRINIQTMLLEIHENSLPNNLEVLDCIKWSGGLKSNTLPSYLKKLRMNTAILLAPNCYPNTLVDLEISEIIHSPLSSSTFPTNLISLRVNKIPTLESYCNSLPSSLRKLVISEKFLPQTSSITLPSGILDLEVPEFNKYYGPIIPSSVQYFRVRSIESNSFLKPSLIPSSCTYLQLPPQFNNPFTPGDISVIENIKHLVFGSSFDQQIVVGSLPQLLSITFGCNYNQPFIKDSIPDSVTSITLGAHFEQVITKECLPNNLKTINFSNSNAVIRSLPDSIENITISKSNVFIFSQISNFKNLNLLKINVC